MTPRAPSGSAQIPHDPRDSRPRRDQRTDRKVLPADGRGIRVYRESQDSRPSGSGSPATCEKQKDPSRTGIPVPDRGLEYTGTDGCGPAASDRTSSAHETYAMQRPPCATDHPLLPEYSETSDPGGGNQATSLPTTQARSAGDPLCSPTTRWHDPSREGWGCRRSGEHGCRNRTHSSSPRETEYRCR